MKRIVCFGDSNTWGFDPEKFCRYPDDVRWTGRLQQLLGNDYKVIEEGQGGRTIACPDPWEWGTKSGTDYVLPMLESQNPIDLLIIMLGTNDLKTKFGLPVPDIAGSLQNMIMKIKSHAQYVMYCPEMKVLVIAPPAIGEHIDKSWLAPFFDAGSTREKSLELGKWYKRVADQFGCDFMDASAIVCGSEKDSVHLTAEGHAVLAEAVYGKVTEILEKI